MKQLKIITIALFGTHKDSFFLFSPFTCSTLILLNYGNYFNFGESSANLQLQIFLPNMTMWFAITHCPQMRDWSLVIQHIPAYYTQLLEHTQLSQYIRGGKMQSTFILNVKDLSGKCLLQINDWVTTIISQNS